MHLRLVKIRVSTNALQTQRKRGWLSSMFFRSSGKGGSGGGTPRGGAAKATAALHDTPSKRANGVFGDAFDGASDDNDDTISGHSAPGETSAAHEALLDGGASTNLDAATPRSKERTPPRSQSVPNGTRASQADSGAAAPRRRCALAPLCQGRRFKVAGACSVGAQAAMQRHHTQLAASGSLRRC